VNSLVITFLFVLLLSVRHVSAQDTTILTFVDEFSVNVNQSLLFQDSEEQRGGFGAGIYFTSPIEKKVQLQSGIEYNLYRTFKSHLYESHFSSTSSNKLSAHIVTIPLNVRIMVGSEIKTFLQAGCFLDFVALSVVKGTRTQGEIDSLGHLTYSTYVFKEHSWANPLNPGFSLAVGNFFKMRKQHLGWKVEYKLGLIPFYSDQTTISNMSGRLSLIWHFR
jgi:hypothetical protein